MDKQECLEILNQKIDEAQEETDRSPEGSSYGTLMLGRKQAFSDVRGLLKTLDEPEITTEQAWEKIAEKFEEGPKELCATLVSALPPYNLSENPEIPAELAKKIENFKGKVTDDYIIYSIFLDDEYDNLKKDTHQWIKDNPGKLSRAVVNGYTIEKAPVWVVKTFAGYLTKFETFVNNNWRATTSNSKDDKDIITFECKEKANEIATLIDGEVEEWSE